MADIEITDEQIQKRYEKLKKDAESGGYNLSDDVEFVKDLVKGIITNENRLGYGACPCRLASGIKEEDLDLICPCDYRDADLTEYGACYCALYVSDEVLKGEKKLAPIPERRGFEEEKGKEDNPIKALSSLPLPIWRCKVCGYLAAREGPPGVCPICKAKKERFEKFI